MRLPSLLAVLPYYLFFQARASPLNVTLPTPSNGTSAFADILDDQTEAFVNQVLSDWKSPGGIAIAFVRKDEEGNWVNVETKGYGIANLKGDNVTEQTNFNIGSNSKVGVARTSL
jgi:CubicO group peptidase (beta-lactamase class C family)